MKKSYWKEAARDFLNSKGRFIAIIAIVALGAGFFGGLKATGIDMKMTGDRYYKEYNMMDFRVISTLGLTKREQKKIKTIEGVKDAMLSYQLDAIIQNNNTGNAEGSVSGDSIARFHSIQREQTVNLLALDEGRLPTQASECVVLTEKDAKTRYKLGDVISIDLDEDPDVKDMLNKTSFTIVGKVSTPFYMSIEKGSTSKGSGSINTFAFIPESAFSMDAYTELYITLDGVSDVFCYSDEYRDKADALLKRLEDIGDSISADRLKKVKDEPQRTLNNAKAEYESQKSDAQRELLQAQDTINKNLSEIVDGEEALSKQEAALVQGEKMLIEQESTANFPQTEKLLYDKATQLNAGEATLDEQLQKLTLTQAMLPPQLFSASIAELNLQKQKLGAAKIELDNAIAQLNDGKARIATEKSRLSSAKTAISKAKAELTGGRAELNAAQTLLNTKFAEADDGLLEAKQKIDDAQAELDDIEKPDWYVQERASAPGHSSFEQDAERIDAIAVVFPVFFFLVAALVCLTTMTRMVEEQRTQVGVLCAMGYRKFTILRKYLLYAAITSISGSVIGLAIGFKLFPRVIWAAYGILYTAPPIMTPWNHKFAITAVSLFLMCIIGSTLAACMGELFSCPAELIRPKPQKNGKRIFIEKIPFIWKHMSFTKKLTARNILRYKKRFFMTVIGIAGCTALMLTGFGVKDSISGIVPAQFNKIYLYDLQIALTHPLSETKTSAQRKMLNAIDRDQRILNTLPVHQQSISALVAGKDKKLDAYLYVPSEAEEITNFIAMKNRATEEKTPLGKTGAVITEKLSRELSLEIGDRITIEDADLERDEIEVTGICENYVYNYVYISKGQYKSIYKEPCEYQSILATISEEALANENQLSTDLLKQDEISSVFLTSAMQDQFAKTFDKLDLVIWVLIFSASLLAFVVLFNLSSINVNERVREIATIKVLGFYNNEVDSYVYRENAVLTIVGILAGFVLGIFLHKFVMNSAEINIVMFAHIIKPASYLWSALLTGLFSFAVNGVIHFRLKKISMVESLKSVE